MKDGLAIWDKAFENRIRLAVMSALVLDQSISFNEFKEMLGASDGNLATHLRQLEDKRYITVKKSFIKRKPNTTYKATEAGKRAFQQHLNALEELVNLDIKE